MLLLLMFMFLLLLFFSLIDIVRRLVIVLVVVLVLAVALVVARLQLLVGYIKSIAVVVVVRCRSRCRSRCRCCRCCYCCCCRCCKPLGSGKVRLVQLPFPYLPWHLSAPEQSRSQVREGATRITVFLKLLEVRVVGLRSRQESNSIWVRRNSLVTQSLNHSLHVRVKENFLTRGQ